MTKRDEQEKRAGSGACPRVRGLLYVDLLMIGGMPLLVVFELVRRLVWFVKKRLKRKPLPEAVKDAKPPQKKAFTLRGFTTVCITIFMAEEFFFGLPYVFMMWHEMPHPNLDVAIQILIFPCHATLHLLLFGPMFY